MQQLDWYIRRLGQMSPREVARRARSSLRDAADRLVVGLRQRQRPLRALLADGNGSPVSPCTLADLAPGQWRSNEAGTDERTWCDRLLAAADRVAAHRLTFFDLEDRHLGDPIDWNRDHGSGKAAPMRFAPSIDYRDFRVTGDCKFVWEPNRHHHLVALGRAYRATGDRRYARAAVEQLASWLDQCPYGIGMNWRSPLELGIRLINWAWALDLIRDSGLLDGKFRGRLLNSVHRHVWEIARKYSYGSSANNHLVGEAAGVFVATSCFPNLREAPRWRADSRDILCREILNQTHPDGGTREQALGYHLFVLQLFLVAGLVARACGDDMPPPYWARLEQMFEFAAAMTEGGENLPMFGDCDDGYVLDLGDPRGQVRPWLAAGAVLFDRPDFKASARGCSETARWLLGREARQRFDGLAPDREPGPLAPRALADSGYWLLQCGERESPERVSVVFDCGPLGMGPLAAHGHADALSFTLRAFGRDVLVDPGTYDYFTYPRWREYFRSTRAHNTVVIDGQDQSVMAGPFLWGRKADARCLRWGPAAHGGTVSGEHDGYVRLKAPAVHRRTLTLDGGRRTLAVRDEVVSQGEHQVDVYFHTAEGCRVTQVSPNRFEIDAGPGTVTLEVDPRLSVRTLRGSEDPIGGWVSRGYHRKEPATTIVGRVAAAGGLSLAHEITVGRPRA